LTESQKTGVFGSSRVASRSREAREDEGIFGGRKFGVGVSMLSDAAIRRIKAPEKPTKLADAKGLFLLLQPTGSKLRRMKYRIGGREKLLSFGAYPEVSLSDARDSAEGTS